MMAKVLSLTPLTGNDPSPPLDLDAFSPGAVYR